MIEFNKQNIRKLYIVGKQVKELYNATDNVLLYRLKESSLECVLKDGSIIEFTADEIGPFITFKTGPATLCNEEYKNKVGQTQNITDIIINDDTSKIGFINNFSFYSFPADIDNFINLSSVIDQSNSILAIGEQAFSMCSNLQNVDFPSISQVGKNAFLACSKLENLNLYNVQVLEPGFINECYNLKTIQFGDNANYYLDENGTGIKDSIIVNKQIDNLHSSIPSISAVVANNKYIGINAFLQDKNLLSAVLIDTQEIYHQAFYNCEKLETVYLMSDNVVQLITTQPELTFKKEDFYNVGVKQPVIAVPAELYDAYCEDPQWSWCFNFKKIGIDVPELDKYTYENEYDKLIFNFADTVEAKNGLLTINEDFENNIVTINAQQLD